ncbi:MAG TPA: protein-L-isoaspartate(D-aspartate) O-methyltransferase [Dehalococcoidia bacterium]|nr:protein-L-isoaspartate(D-aspartate) O-methyltransferase [Dehalococcoidia bacterium]
MTAERRDAAIEEMVRLVGRVVRDERVLDAMREVPRDEFVPERVRRYAFDDQALPIGEGQTISQPLIVGMMTEAARLDGHEHVLEVGTGSGYQAAILARLVRDVVSVEIVGSLREQAARTLARLGVTNVTVLPAGEELGAPAFAPYDAILVTAVAPSIPPTLMGQLRVGGRMVLPVGKHADDQELLVVTRTAAGIETTSLGGVRFVPLRGAGGFEEDDESVV